MCATGSASAILRDVTPSRPAFPLVVPSVLAYNTDMVIKLTDEMRQAIQAQPNGPIYVIDDATDSKYVLLPDETYEKMRSLLFDDSEFDPKEAYPLLDKVFGGPEGWDAPGMELYDEYDAHRSKS